MPLWEWGSDKEQRNYTRQAHGPSLDSTGQAHMPTPRPSVPPQPPSPEHVECKQSRHLPPLPASLLTSPPVCGPQAVVHVT